MGQGFREQGRSGNRLGKLAGIGAEIAPDGDICPIEAPAVGKKLRVIGDEQLEAAPFEDVTSFAQGNQATVEVQDGVFVLPGALHIDLGSVGIHGDPGRSCGEASIRCAVPLHRCPGVVAPLVPDAVPRPRLLRIRLCLFQKVQAFNVPQLRGIGKGIIRHADLLTLINKGRPPLQIHGHGQHLGAPLPERLRRSAAPARHDAGLVVVAPEQRVPVQCALPRGGQRLELFQRKGDHVPLPVLAVDVHDVKLEQQVQFSPVPDDTVRVIQSDAGRFAYAHTIPAVKAAFAHLAQMGMQCRLEGRMLARKGVA